MPLANESDVDAVHARVDVLGEMMHAALDILHQQQQRITALEAQLKAARKEIRRYVAEKMGGEE